MNGHPWRSNMSRYDTEMVSSPPKVEQIDLVGYNTNHNKTYRLWEKELPYDITASSGISLREKKTVT